MKRILNSELNTMFLRTGKRAENYSNEQLVNTFVNAGLLFEALNTNDHQIVYGRRGTGKTHALRYLADSRSRLGDISIYVDIGRLGSDSSIYNDPALSVPERSVRLLRDVLNEIHDGFLRELIDNQSVNLTRLSELLDQLAQAMPKVEVYGSAEHEETEGRELAKKFSISGSFAKASSALGIAGEKSDKNTLGFRRKDSGTKRYGVRFPEVGAAIDALVGFAQGRRVWIILDEWSSLHEDIQPFLADMLRKSFFKITHITVKIAAIEHRSKFYSEASGGGYTGFELGADIGSNLNLDDYLVFDNDQQRSKDFFADLFLRHITAVAAEKEAEAPGSAEELIQIGFTRDRAFEELVRASEGVPRDAIQIIARAAQKANDKQISIPNIRQAARVFYQTDKSDVVISDTTLSKLLTYVINQVIGNRRRYF